MKIRNILLSMSLLFSGAARAEYVEHQVYQQELVALKEKAELQRIFDTKLNGISRKIELNIHNYKRIPNPWERLGLMFILGLNVLCINSTDMPEFYSFIDELAVKSGIPTPYIFITLTEGPLNAFAMKLIKPAAIIIDQTAFNKLSDEQLKAAIVHEIGHVKYEHVNKRTALLLSTFAVSCYFLGDAAKAIANYMVKNSNDFFKRQSVIIENQVRIVGAALIVKLVEGLIIGKRFEKQADQFAFEAGYASSMIDVFNAFQKERDIIENDLVATKALIAAEQESMTPENIKVLNQELNQLEHPYRLSQWIHENTPFEPHPTNADRIAAAQAYLDVQAAQVPAIEKA